MFTGNRAPAPSMAHDPFSAIDTASTHGQRNPYLLPGQYHLRVERVFSLESREGKLFFIVEATILASDNHERPEGTVITWMTNMRIDMGPINAKRFLAAALGYDVESDEANAQINGDVARVACAEDNPLMGREVYAQCNMVKTKQKTDFLNVSWRPANQPPA